MTMTFSFSANPCKSLFVMPARPMPVRAAKSTKPTAASKPAPLAKPPTAAAARATYASTTASGVPKLEVGLYNPQGLVRAGVGAGNAPAPRPNPPPDASAPAGSFVTQGGRVVVDVQSSDSGYENQIYWSSDNFATRHLLGVDNHVATVDLGEFARGTRIDFGIVNGANQFFRTGAASTNSDNYQHATSAAEPGGALTIGFEDLAAGGDADFNDAIVRVRGLSTPVPAMQTPATQTTAPAASPALSHAPVAPATKVAVPANKHGDNRSGLGDGSNPGQGAGRVNSPNQGTLNPGQAGSAGPVEAAAPKSKLKAAAMPAVTKPNSLAEATTEKNRQLVEALYAPAKAAPTTKGLGNAATKKA